MNAPLLKSCISAPISTTTSLPSTKRRTPSFMSLPSYMPQYAGCSSFRTPLSAIIVAKGIPAASRNRWTSSARPERAVSTPGRAQALFARPSMSATACTAASSCAGSLAGAGIGCADPTMGIAARSAGKAM